MTKRCFMAIDIESADKRSLLAEIQDTITEHGDMRPVPSENFHITMNFLGDVKEDEIDMITRDIREAVTESPCKNTIITIGGLGVFPKKSYISVVWAGILQGRSYLADLHEAVIDPLPRKHIDEHDFTPHITLARVSDISSEEKTRLHRIIDEHEDTSYFRKEVDSIKLKESVLRGDSPTYRTIEEYKL